MEPWNEQMTREFSIYKCIMWPVGTWPFNTNRNLSTLRAAIACLLEALMMINLVNDLMAMVVKNIDVMIDAFGLTACAFIAISKISLLRWYRGDLVTIMRNAAVDWSTVKFHGTHQIMREYADLGRLIFFCQMSFSYFTAVAIILTPLTLTDAPVTGSGNGTNGSEYEILSESEANGTRYEANGIQYEANETARYAKILPLGTVCQYSEDSDAFCKARYVLQSFEVATSTTGNIGVDVFLYGLAFHLCGQFEALGYDISQLGKDENVTDERENVKRLVKRHCLLLELANRLEFIARHVLLVQLTADCLHICLIGLQLIGNLRMRNYLLMSRTVVEFSVIMMQLYLYCYIGESLTSRVEEIMEAVCRSDWYNLSTKTIKSLSLIISRTTMPFYITAGAFYYMNLNNFKNIVKLSFSYMSVLQIMFED